MSTSTLDAAALLSAMAEHGIRVQDRVFERVVRELLADHARLRAVDAAARAYLAADGYEQATAAVHALRAAVAAS